VLRALFDASLFRLLLPRFLDGGEVDPLTFVQVIEQIARHDASAAWCLCQAAGCSMTAAYLGPEAARDIFGDRRAVLAWGPSHDAKAVAVDGEQRVQIRLASTYGIHQAKQVVDTVHHAAGSSAIFTSSAFERRFRDIHTVTQQLQGRQAHLETVGRYLLGLPPDQTFL